MTIKASGGLCPFCKHRPDIRPQLMPSSQNLKNSLPHGRRPYKHRRAVLPKAGPPPLKPDRTSPQPPTRAAPPKRSTKGKNQTKPKPKPTPADAPGPPPPKPPAPPTSAPKRPPQKRQQGARGPSSSRTPAPPAQSPRPAPSTPCHKPARSPPEAQPA